MSIGKYVIVRTYSAGVHIGVLRAKYLAGSRFIVELTETSRIWKWSDANTLDEIALRGVGEDSRISEQAPYKEIPDVIEILHTTAEAEANLRRPRW